MKDKNQCGLMGGTWVTELKWPAALLAKSFSILY